MKLKTALALLSLLLFGVFGVSTAQTTVTTSKPFICDPASRYPIFYFGEFSCRGIGTIASDGVEYFFWGQPRIEIFTSNYSIGPYTSTLTLTGFTQPSNGQPGTYSFNWSGTDGNGVAHAGFASGTWVDQLICGGRGCQWHAPKLLSTSFTVSF